mmetsp:Transcript_40392/g.64876  ORF Transcript_40392/g.64876 Transcript_40392/m.64876 type:complete len:85 (-) Transcript_40392:1031-1285(-)
MARSRWQFLSGFKDHIVKLRPIVGLQRAKKSAVVAVRREGDGGGETTVCTYVLLVINLVASIAYSLVISENSSSIILLFRIGER